MPTQATLTMDVRPETVAHGFTQSELSMLDECALKWNFRYNNLLTKVDQFNWYSFVGTAWHIFQEEWRTHNSDLEIETPYFPMLPKGIVRTAEFEKELEYWTAVLPTYQRVYANFYREEKAWEPFLIEKELSSEILGYKIRGKIDLACSKPKFIRDFKTTSSAWLTSPNGWHFKLQFMTYCWLMFQNDPEWCKGGFDFQLDILQKPGLKETKADRTWQGHIQRVCQDIQDRPEFYLRRETKKIMPDQIMRFEKNVLIPKIQRIALAIDNPKEAQSIVTNPNTNACNVFGNQCEFFEICERGWSAGKFFFTNRPTKHEEL